MHPWLIWIFSIVGQVVYAVIELVRLRKPNGVHTQRIIIVLIVANSVCGILSIVSKGRDKPQHIPTTTEFLDSLSLRETGHTREWCERTAVANATLTTQLSETTAVLSTERERRVKSETLAEDLCWKAYKDSLQTIADRAFIAYEAEDYRQAKLLFCQALNEEHIDLSRRARIFFLIGTMQLSWDDNEGALISFDSCLAQESGFSRAWNMKGYALEKLKKPLLALAAYDSALLSDTSNTDGSAWNNKGTALADLKLFDESIVCFDSALIREPQSSLYWNNRATIENRWGHLNTALANFDSALKYNHEFGNAWVERAGVLKALKRLPEALASSDSGLTYGRDSENAWCRHGSICQDLGRFLQAASDFDSALALNHRNALTWNNRAAALGNAGLPREAILCTDSALYYDPSSGLAWTTRGAGLYAVGDTVGAVRAFFRAIQCGFESAVVLHNLGTVLMQAGDAETALRVYAIVVRKMPDEAFGWRGLSEAIMHLGDFCGALDVADSGLARNPGDPGLIELKEVIITTTQYLDQMNAAAQHHQLAEARIDWERDEFGLWHVTKTIRTANRVLDECDSADGLSE